MNKLYDRIDFHNGTTPALNEDNLNAMSKGIDDIDNRVISIAGDVLVVVPQIQAYLDQAEDLVEALETLSQNPPYIGANGNWYVWDTNTNQFVDSGIDASITVDIADVTAIAPDATPYVTNTGTNTDPVFHLFIPRGQTGQTGNGIASITKTSTSGNVDTYTITMTDGSTATFTVTNGTGSTFAGLSDVSLSNLQNGDVPKWNTATQKWENGAGGGGASALNDLSDVTITSATQGQVLIKGASNWENAALTKNNVGLENVDNTSDLNKPISTATQSALNTKTDKDALKVTAFNVTTTGWTADTTSQSGTTLYKKQVTLSHIYGHPSVDIGASTGNVLPTTAEQEAYDLVQYVTFDDTVPCLYLYASDTPTSAFNIDVEGVD